MAEIISSLAAAESLLVVRGLGLQISSKLYSGKEKKVFIEKKKIESIIINEGVQAWSILYYMAILVKGKEKMILPFEVRCNLNYLSAFFSRTH